MPASAKRRDLLVDTSVAVALVVSDHAFHESTSESIGTRRLGLAGHAAFETFSVLTRLPAPTRLTPAAAHRVMSSNFPASRFLGDEEAAKVLDALPTLGIAGGAVYDALVGAAAVQHAAVLATRDRRAVDTYRALDVELEILE